MRPVGVSTNVILVCCYSCFLSLGMNFSECLLTPPPIFLVDTYDVPDGVQVPYNRRRLLCEPFWEVTAADGVGVQGR
jgi:hypothetical protein